jgi:hypothetical protein
LASWYLLETRTLLLLLLFPYKHMVDASIAILYQSYVLFLLLFLVPTCNSQPCILVESRSRYFGQGYYDPKLGTVKKTFMYFSRVMAANRCLKQKGGSH